MSTFHGRASELLGGKPGLFACQEVGRDAPKGFVTGRAACATAAAAVIEAGEGGGAKERGGRRK